MSIKTLKALACIFLLSGTLYVHGQINNYTFPQNVQTIPLGSLIIGMDNATQSSGADFNLKAYGLVNHLLKNGIPVKWIIKSNKVAVTDYDLTSVQAQREFPSSLSQSAYNFLSGPFIIDSSFASVARPLINAFGNRVNVYRTINNISADIHYTLKNSSKIAVLTDGGSASFHKAILDSAGFALSDYNLISARSLAANDCYTVASESEDRSNTLSDTSFTNPVKRFVTSGGNFFAQSTAILPYENKNHFVSLSNLAGGVNNYINIKNPNLPFIQTDGLILNAQGLFKTMILPSGSFLPNTFSVMEDNTGPSVNYKAITRKYGTTTEGGNVFYFAGQTSVYKWSGNDSRNAYRVYLNAVMMPAQRKSSCTETDIEVKAFLDVNSVCLNDTVNIKIAISNLDGLTANNLVVKKSVTPGFALVSADAGTGSFNPAANTWTVPSLNYAKSDTLRLSYKATVAINTNISAYVIKNDFDNNQLNDSARLSMSIKPVPTINAGNDTSVCKGSQVKLGTDSVAGNSYQWKFISGSFISNAAYPVLSPLSSTSYVLTKTTLSSGCQALDTVQVSVTDVPVFDLGAERNICVGDSVQIDLPVISGMVYNWSSSPAGISHSGSSIQIMPLTTMKLFAQGIVNNNASCSREDSLELIVSLPPTTSSINTSDTSTYHPYADISANYPLQGTGVWSVASGGGNFVNISNATTKILNLSMGVNILRWTITSSGCPPSYDDLSIFLKDLNIPQGFSPNGDGLNDAFVVEGIEEFPASKIEILTRWGVSVFSDNNYKNTWKGENNQEEKLPDDTYYFILRISDGRIYKSYVVVKR